MTLSMTQQMKQSQTLILSARMEQSLHVLEMSAEQLEDYLGDAYLKNPLIEISPREVRSHERIKTAVRNTDGENSDDFMSNLAYKGDSLTQMLKEQLWTLRLDDHIEKLCYFFAESVDERGYLSTETFDFLRQNGVPDGLMSSA